MNDLASLCIDVEGFGKLYNSEHDSLWGLHCLMEGVYRIGSRIDEIAAGRVFAHQIGDGFVLYYENYTSGHRALCAIAVALAQYTLLRSRHFTKSAIDAGGMSDVLHCYPKIVLDNRIQGGTTVRLGEGLMTIFPVMGTSIINTYKLSKRVRGAVVAIQEDHRPKVGDGFVWGPNFESQAVATVNWLRSSNVTIRRARQILGIDAATEAELMRCYTEAIERNQCPEQWLNDTAQHLEL